MKRFCVISLLLAFSGCTDAFRSSIYAYGDKAEIECYSGGKLVYKGKSTGRMATVEGSDGWQFREEGTDKFVRVSGDCIIKN